MDPVFCLFFSWAARYWPAGWSFLTSIFPMNAIMSARALLAYLGTGGSIVQVKTRTPCQPCVPPWEQENQRRAQIDDCILTWHDNKMRIQTPQIMWSHTHLIIINTYPVDPNRAVSATEVCPLKPCILFVIQLWIDAVLWINTVDP